MPLTLPKISRTGTTPSRKRFWDNARETLLGLQKVAGRNVTVDEHKGKGTFINVNRPPSTAVTGACCVGTDCSITTEADCTEAGGTWQGPWTLCDPNPCTGGGACCNLDTHECTIAANHDACVDSGGIYLGDGTTCEGVDCTCCPLFDPYTQVLFSGQVLNCSSGTVDIPQQTWTKVAAAFGCTMDPQEFSTDSNCSCAFNAYNCFPFTNVNYVAIDETGACADPFSFGFNYFLRAQINCDGTVYFDGSATPIDPAPACATAQLITPVGPYDLTAGPLDVTVNADTGDTSIQFRFILSLA